MELRFFPPQGVPLLVGHAVGWPLHSFPLHPLYSSFILLTIVLDPFWGWRQEVCEVGEIEKLSPEGHLGGSG